MFGGARQHCFIIKLGIRSDEKKTLKCTLMFLTKNKSTPAAETEVHDPYFF